MIDICSNLKTKKKNGLFILAGEWLKILLGTFEKSMLKKRLEKNIYLGISKMFINFYQDMDFAINTLRRRVIKYIIRGNLSMKLPIISFDIGGNKEFL